MPRGSIAALALLLPLAVLLTLKLAPGSHRDDTNQSRSGPARLTLAAEQRPDDSDWADCLQCHPEYDSKLPRLSDLRRSGLGSNLGMRCEDCHTQSDLDVPRSNWTHPVRPVGAHLACTKCHAVQPHSASQPPPLPTGDYLVRGCFSCHSEVDEKLHLYSGHSGIRAVSCRDCHPAHEPLRAALPLDLLPRSVARNWGNAYDYAQSNASCTRCHPDAWLMTPLDHGFVTLNTVNYHSLHVRQGQCLCTECHEPHGSMRTKLLRSTLLSGDSMTVIEKTDGATCSTRCHGVDHNGFGYINRVD